jgi:hypothetical protein
MGTITYEDGKGHPSDPLAELLTCLQVLGEYVDSTPDDAELYNSEFLTACWQTIELVSQLLETHQELLALMDQMIEAQRQLAAKQKIVVAGKGAVPNIRSLDLPK